MPKDKMTKRQRRKLIFEAQNSSNQGQEGDGGGPGGSGGPRHPPHLRGRQIGHFYAQLNKEKRIESMGQKEGPSKPLGTILISESKRQHIQGVLDSTPSHGFSNKDSQSYNHVQDSTFKRDFLKTINESLGDKLDRASLGIYRDRAVDERVFEQHMAKENDSKYRMMMAKRMKLPSFGMKEEVLKVIQENQVSVISGETGCGKTTQVAQFILDDYIEKKKGSMCRILCTQPRRISAISVAERVAEERAEPLGKSVGYQIRLEWKFPRDKASIMFCTTGVVLKRMETDPGLSSISHLILDEIHERDVMSDFILALIKQVMARRRDLKVILMSATLNSEKFSRYYDNAPHLNIPGFTYPVQEYYLEDALARTGFDFDDDAKTYGGRGNDAWKNRRKKGKKGRAVDDDFMDFIEPHIRLLEAEGKYTSQVLNQLRNPESEKLNVDLIAALIEHICENEKEEGAILVFLTGFAEIQGLNDLLEKSGKFPRNKYRIHPLHSLMPTVDQKLIFETPPRGVRKIIISTNIAETSITIDDVVFVIDCGRIKISNFDAENNQETLSPEWVALANASQRKGRAGRVKPGICFHLYSKAREMTFDQYQKPEILRKRLEDVILTAKVLQIGKVESFFASLIDSPEPEAVDLALSLLKQMEALTESEDLTPLGYHLAKLPMAPQMGKMILMGAIFSCLDPVLSIAATLDFKDAFQLPLGKEKEADSKREELADGVYSDHILYHTVLDRFCKSGGNRNFCWHYFLSPQTLKLLQDMKHQFMKYLHEMNFVANADPLDSQCNRNSGNLSLIKAVVCAGLYPNVVIRKSYGKNGKKTMFFTLNQKLVSLHPKSVLTHCKDFDSPLLVYYRKVKSSSDFIHDATLIEPLPVVFFGDNFSQYREENRNSIVIGKEKRLRFLCSENSIAIVKQLRDRFNDFLEYKISHPGPVEWGAYSEIATKVLGLIVELITIEDTAQYDIDAFDDFD